MVNKIYIGKNFAVDLTDIAVITLHNNTIQLTNTAGISFDILCFSQHSAELVFNDITTKWKVIKNEN